MTTNNKIAIIFGAGAVENAWQPVLDAFRLLWRCEIDVDSANCLFARQIYLLRAYSKFQDTKSSENLKIEKEQVQFLKEIICNQIKIAQKNGSIRPREEFAKILEKFVFRDMSNMFGLVSTNWDTVIDDKADEIVGLVYDDIDSAKCFHIHGSSDLPNKLYLPSETTHENYRSDEENKALGLNHYLTLNFLKDANQIILYGISIDPLDAELSQILNSAFTSENNLQEVIIINPEYDKIRNRVKLLLLPKNNIKLRCYSPENLEKEL